MNRLRFLNEEEEARLLAEAEEPLRTIVLLGIYAGLGITAEALSLKKTNVDLERRLLTIEATYTKNRKTQTIPMHSKLVEPLKARMAESTRQALAGPSQGKGKKSGSGKLPQAVNDGRTRDKVGAGVGMSGRTYEHERYWSLFCFAITLSAIFL